MRMVQTPRARERQGVTHETVPPQTDAPPLNRPLARSAIASSQVNAAHWSVRNERIQRSGGSKPHLAEFAWRSGGEDVYVNPSGGRVLTPIQFRTLAARKPAAARGYLLQRRNARLMVKGRVSHADHATILLRGWHSVWMNKENESQAMRSVAFID